VSTPEVIHAPKHHQKVREMGRDRYMGRSGNDRSDTEHRVPSISEELSWPLHQCLKRWAAVYGFALELRSFLHRISLRGERRYDLYGLDLGPFHEAAPDGRLRWNTRTHACTRDIENFVERRPWATMVDLEIYRDAWASGAEWADSNSCSSAQHSLSQEPSVVTESIAVQDPLQR
jgi:hypothetical protein